MTQWVRRGERITDYHYGLTFEWDDTPGAGFSFDCDKDGNVLTDSFIPLALDNLKHCLANDFPEGTVHSTGITKYVNSYWEPGIIVCERCDNEVVLYNTLTNTCEKCDTDYNAFGQRLGPREFWGEDTGESLADIEQANIPMGWGLDRDYDYE